MKVSNEKRDLVLKAVMNRYKGLTNLIGALQEDCDTVYVNLEDDVDGELDCDTIGEIVTQIVSA